MNKFSLSGNIVDLINEEIFPGTITIVESKITDIVRDNEEYDNFIMPGFIDAHVHIESSMLIPSEFARLAATHGTVATVSDPHEIANVLGIKGIDFMIENGNQVPFKFFFGAPSCVPATTFETSGATIGADDIRSLLQKKDIKYLSEMMNFPGVLLDFPEVIEKIKIAKEFDYPIDGHAPGLMSNDVQKYIDAGISTDHECFTLKEALGKISLGMKILIREGSAANNFEALHPLIDTHNDMVMLCSDDKHPDDLCAGHINILVKRALDLGYDLIKILKTAILNPINHYKLNIGLLQIDDDADFIIVDNLSDFNINKTFIKGYMVAKDGMPLIKSIPAVHINKFDVKKKSIDDFHIQTKGKKIRVIEALDGQLITNEILINEKIEKGNVISDTENDILKIAVVNRYSNEKPALGFIKNFGLKRGAIASSVAHDSHNIIAVAADDESLCASINAIIENKGGMAVFDEKEIDVLRLPIAGLMTDEDGFIIAERYSKLSAKVRGLGSTLNAPFMTLSFMALLVIPKLKISDKGLFNGEKFEFVDLQV